MGFGAKKTQASSNNNDPVVTDNSGREEATTTFLASTAGPNAAQPLLKTRRDDATKSGMIG